MEETPKYDHSDESYQVVLSFGAAWILNRTNEIILVAFKSDNHVLTTFFLFA